MRIGKAERAARADLIRWTFDRCGRGHIGADEAVLEMAVRCTAFLFFAELDRACCEVAAKPPEEAVIISICQAARRLGGEEVLVREAAWDARARAAARKGARR